jgi:hypothetical protein
MAVSSQVTTESREIHHQTHESQPLQPRLSVVNRALQSLIERHERAGMSAGALNDLIELKLSLNRLARKVSAEATA